MALRYSFMMWTITFLIQLYNLHIVIQDVVFLYPLVIKFWKGKTMTNKSERGEPDDNNEESSKSK